MEQEAYGKKTNKAMACVNYGFSGRPGVSASQFESALWRISASVSNNVVHIGLCMACQPFAPPVHAVDFIPHFCAWWRGFTYTQG